MYVYVYQIQLARVKVSVRRREQKDEKLKIKYTNLSAHLVQILFLYCTYIFCLTSIIQAFNPML